MIKARLSGASWPLRLGTQQAAGGLRLSSGVGGLGQNLPSQTCKSTRDQTDQRSELFRDDRPVQEAAQGCARRLRGVGSASVAGGLHLLGHSRPRAKPRTNTERRCPPPSRGPDSRSTTQLSISSSSFCSSSSSRSSSSSLSSSLLLSGSSESAFLSLSFFFCSEASFLPLCSRL